MIKFGAWSITLAIGSAHGLAMAMLLWRTHANAAANRWLAALLVIVVLMITPYTIGYAGFYDAWPWLTFAPFNWQLGIGPLIWLYVRQLGAERRPPGWGWHFVPLALQVGYYTLLFCLPLETKRHWDDAMHETRVAPAERLLVTASLVVYLVAASRDYRRYQRWLADHSAAREELRLAWLRGFLTSMAAVTAVAVGFGVTHVLVRPLTYFDEFPLYLVYTALVWYLGVEGWRQATRPYPRRAEAAAVVPNPPSAPQAPLAAGPAPQDPRPAKSSRDWNDMGQRIRQQVVAGRWWSEPELELAELARRVGLNTHYLSRALNEGLRMSFSEFINRLRVEAAQQRLLAEGDVLEIAFEVGFRAKASFNRAFKAYAGMSPTEWRARQRAAVDPVAGPTRLES